MTWPLILNSKLGRQKGTSLIRSIPFHFHFHSPNPNGHLPSSLPFRYPVDSCHPTSSLFLHEPNPEMGEKKVAGNKRSYEECRRERVEENKKRMEQLNLNKLAKALSPSPKSTPVCVHSHASLRAQVFCFFFFFFG